MAEREKTARVDLKVRMKEALRAQIEAAARERGVSLNAEAESRLERSFAWQNHVIDVFGGSAESNVALVMTAAFHHTGETQAGSKPAAEWLRDPDIFESAMRAVVRALWSIHPDETPERKKAWLRQLRY